MVMQLQMNESEHAISVTEALQEYSDAYVQWTNIKGIDDADPVTMRVAEVNGEDPLAVLVVKLRSHGIDDVVFGFLV